MNYHYQRQVLLSTENSMCYPMAPHLIPSDECDAKMSGSYRSSVDFSDKSARGGVFVYFAFFVVGVSSLLPWSLYNTAHSYYCARFGPVFTVDDDEQLIIEQGLYELSNLTEHHLRNALCDYTYHQRNFETFFAITVTAVAFISTVFNVAIQHRVGDITRAFLGHLILIISLLATIIMVTLPLDDTPNVFFEVTIGIIALSAVGGLGLLQGSAMGLAATLGSQFLQSQVVGQTIAGILCAVVSVLSHALTPFVDSNGFIYFAFFFVYICFSLIIYLQMRRSKFVQSSLKSIKLYDEWPLTLCHSCECSKPNGANTTDRCRSCNSVKQLRVIRQRTHVVSVLKKMRYEVCLIFVVYTSTFAVYPAVASRVRSASENQLIKTYFTPISCFLNFSLGNLAGRIIAYWWQEPHKDSVWMAVLVVGRLILVPVIHLSNMGGRCYLPVVFNADWMFVLALGLLSVSLGYFAALLNVNAIERCATNDREMAAAVALLLNVTAVTTGSLIAYPMVVYA